MASDQASESRATKQILCVGIISDFGKGILPVPSDPAHAAAFPTVLDSGTLSVPDAQVLQQIDHSQAGFEQLDHLIGANSDLFPQQNHLADRPLQHLLLPNVQRLLQIRASAREGIDLSHRHAPTCFARTGDSGESSIILGAESEPATASVSENNPMRRVWSVISLTDDCDQAITRVPNWHTFFLGVDQYVHYRSWAASCAVSAESTGNHVNDYSELCFI
jgi:hypothetical protein